MKTRKRNHALDRHLIREYEKGQYGEVFTPIHIIDEMLASLPSNVWSNPSLQWLDPACGIGNFPLQIIYGGSGYPGLFQGLASVLPDENERKRQIVSMIHCYDINKSNIRAFRISMHEFYNGPANIYHADFLETLIHTQFDIVVGNPPYNSGGTKRVGEKRLHIRFAERALTLLNKHGFLAFVCPPNYRQAGSTMNVLFQGRGCFRYIRILGPEETHKLFQVQSRVDVFLYQLGCKSATHIVDEYGSNHTLHLDLSRHIPNFGHSIVEKLRSLPNANIVAFRSAEATTIGCNRFVKKSGFPTLHLIISEGRKILLRGDAHSLQHVPKIIVNGLGVPYVFYDAKGVYGVTQTPLVIRDPSAELVAFMRSKLFCFLVWALRLTGNNNLPYIFEDVPANFGKSLQFTKAEQELIDSFVVPIYADADIPIVCGSVHSGTRKKRGT